MGASTMVVNALVSQPLYRLQFIMQTQPELVALKRLPSLYANVNACMADILARDGMMGFWRGTTMTICMKCIQQFAAPYILYQLHNFFSPPKIPDLSKYTEEERKWISSQKQSSNNMIQRFGYVFTNNFLFISIFPILVSYPFDYMRFRLMVDLRQNNSKAYRFSKGSFSVFHQTLVSDGLSGFFRGLTPMIFAFGLGQFVGMPLHKLAMPLSPFGVQDWRSRILLGTSIGILTGAMVYPLSTVRRRMMLRSCEKEKYQSSLHCMKQVVQEEGIRSLYRGLGIQVVRSIFLAGTFAGWEVSSKLFNQAS